MENFNVLQLRNEQPTHKLNSVVCFLTAVISIPRTQENALCCAYKNNIHNEIRNFRKSKFFKRENR